MANLVYFLNLQRVFPASILPRQIDIIKAWNKQSPTKMVLVMPTRQLGSYKIQCTSVEEYVKLEQFFLELNLQSQVYRIPLEKPYKKRSREDYINFDNQTVRVTLVGACDDELVMESNEKFDEYFEEYAEIKSPTKLDKYPDTDVFNGKRSFIITLHKDKHIEREINYAMENSERDKILKV